LDLLVGQHALDARHLLDLKPHRVGVLERDRQQVTELHAATLLHLDDVPPELVAFALIFAEVFDVIECELAHGHSSGRPWRGIRKRPRTKLRGRRRRNGSAGASDAVAADLLEALREATGVALLRASQRLQPLADLLEALVAGGAGEPRVHLGVLLGLALDRRLEVGVGRADLHARHRVADLRQEVEVTERVAGLTLGDGTEEGGDVGVALDVGLLREVEVAPVGLALSREGLLQVVVGLGSFAAWP
jgi:hypothetical protein